MELSPNPTGRHLELGLAMELGPKSSGEALGARVDHGAKL